MGDVRNGDVAILVDRVSHAYAQRTQVVRVLDAISLVIHRGAFVALVGPSGCGKTTLLDILSGLVSFQSGRVMVAGKLPQAGRRDTARMFARDALLPWLSAYYNVDFAARTRRRQGEDGREPILAILRDVGLEGFEETYPRQLSQGMRQRVALARTFSLQSEHLFLDEPFGALDAQTRERLQDDFLKIWSKVGTTVLFVTHSIDEALVLSDRIFVFTPSPGRIKRVVQSPLAGERLGGDVRAHPAYGSSRNELRHMLSGTEQ